MRMSRPKVHLDFISIDVRNLLIRHRKERLYRRAERNIVRTDVIFRRKFRVLRSVCNDVPAPSSTLLSPRVVPRNHEFSLRLMASKISFRITTTIQTYPISIIHSRVVKPKSANTTAGISERLGHSPVVPVCIR